MPPKVGASLQAIAVPGEPRAKRSEDERRLSSVQPKWQDQTSSLPVSTSHRSNKKSVKPGKVLLDGKTDQITGSVQPKDTVQQHSLDEGFLSRPHPIKQNPGRTLVPQPAAEWCCSVPKLRDSQRAESMLLDPSVSSLHSDSSLPERKRTRKKRQQRSSTAGGTGQPDEVPPVATGRASGSQQLSLLAKMRSKLQGSRFRWLNQQLYMQPGTDSYNLMHSDPALFQEYHEVWPLQLDHCTTDCQLSCCFDAAGGR